MPWYFLILVMGAVSLWAMSRLEDSRLGRAWMAIREDETAADCTGVNPISTKLLAFALGASFSGFAGSIYAAKLQAITPGAFEFQVSIMLLCMVVLGGAGSLTGVDPGRACSSRLRPRRAARSDVLRALDRATTGVPALAAADLTLWRWFFFGLGLVLVMLLRPQGLVGPRGRDRAAADGWTSRSRKPRAAGRPSPAWLRDAGPGRAAARRPILEVRGLTKASAGSWPSTEVDLVVPRGGIVGLIGPNGAGKTTFFNAVTGLHPARRAAASRSRAASIVGLRPNAIVARGIARTFQSIRLFPQMTVLDNVLVGEHCRLRASVAGAVLRPPAVVAEEARARAAGARSAGASSACRPGRGPGAQPAATATSGGWRSRARSPPSRASCCSTSPTAGMNPQRDARRSRR